MNNKLPWTLAVLGVALMVAVTAAQAEDDSAEKPDVMKLITCPISGKAVNATATAEHNGGEVYFCCKNCVKAFSEDATKWATKANYQLVATKQAKQVGCPMSGGPVKEATMIEVAQGDAKVGVGFCCEKCQGAANKAEGDKQLEMLFGEKAFAKAFKVPEEETEKKAG